MRRLSPTTSTVIGSALPQFVQMALPDISSCTLHNSQLKYCRKIPLSCVRRGIFDCVMNLTSVEKIDSVNLQRLICGIWTNFLAEENTWCCSGVQNLAIWCARKSTIGDTTILPSTTSVKHATTMHVSKNARLLIQGRALTKFNGYAKHQTLKPTE